MNKKPTSHQQAVIWNRTLKKSEYSDRRVTFGKYTNTRISELPNDYLSWGTLNLTEPWAYWFSRELIKRGVVK